MTRVIETTCCVLRSQRHGPVLSDRAEHPGGHRIRPGRVRTRVVVTGAHCGGAAAVELQGAPVSGDGGVDGLDGGPVVDEAEEPHPVGQRRAPDAAVLPCCLDARGEVAVVAGDRLGDLATELVGSHPRRFGQGRVRDLAAYVGVGDRAGRGDQLAAVPLADLPGLQCGEELRERRAQRPGHVDAGVRGPLTDAAGQRDLGHHVRLVHRRRRRLRTGEGDQRLHLERGQEGLDLLDALQVGDDVHRVGQLRGVQSREQLQVISRRRLGQRVQTPQAPRRLLRAHRPSRPPCPARQGPAGAGRRG